MDVRFDILITILVFSVYTLLSNIIPNWIKFPWDVDLGKIGVAFYIPIVSSIIVSTAIILTKNFFGF